MKLANHPTRYDETAAAFRANVGKTTESLVDAATLAEILGVSRDYVYRHAGELGGRRLGGGKQGRLRFSPSLALESLSACEAGSTSHTAEPRIVEPKRRARTPGGLGSDVVLLPIRARKAAA